MIVSFVGVLILRMGMRIARVVEIVIGSLVEFVLLLEKTSLMLTLVDFIVEARVVCLMGLNMIMGNRGAFMMGRLGTGMMSSGLGIGNMFARRVR